MTSTCIEISEHDFELRFPLIRNHLREDASWCVDDARGCLFETFGPELEFVHRQDARTVWTLVDLEDGLTLLSGLHVVNRVGYLISRSRVPKGESILVRCEAP